MSSAQLEWNPPHLRRMLSTEEARDALVLVDVLHSEAQRKRLRLSIDVSFAPVGVPVGQLVVKTYWLGCLAARVDVELKGGQVVEYSDPRAFDVSYERSSTSDDDASLRVEPTIKLGDGVEFGLGAGSVGGARSTENRLAFSGNESTVTPIGRGSNVMFLIQLPLVEHAVRNYLAGNLKVTATGEWPDGKVQGTIRVRPTHTCWFDERSRAVSSLKSTAMSVLLWCKGKKDQVRAGGWELIFSRKD